MGIRRQIFLHEFFYTRFIFFIPGMSVPAGHVDGLPVGVQFLANHFDEYRMFVAAYALEAALS